MELIEFTQGEIGELQRLIEVHVHHTVLQKLFILSENPTDKSTCFITIYRIINSFTNYASTNELKEKLKKLIKESEKTYNEIYPLVLNYSNTNIEFGKQDLIDDIVEIFCNKEKNSQINKIIDSFIVFGEKVELNRLEDFMGVDLDTDHGKEAMKDIKKVIDTDNI